MKPQAACVHASREEPCWGDCLPTLSKAVTCAGHYYVEATGGRYVAQGERHAFEKRIASQRAENAACIEDMGGTVDLSTIADLAEHHLGEDTDTDTDGDVDGEPVTGD